MKKKYILSAVALMAMVSVLCSCFPKKSQSPATYIASPPESADDADDAEASGSAEESEVDSEGNSEESDEIDDTESSDEESDIDDSDTYLSSDDPNEYIIHSPVDYTYIFPEELEELAAQSMFVGDSVCRGFFAYGFVPASNSFADGSIGARNLPDYDVYYSGADRKFESVLTEVSPEFLVLSMGMNDLNMTTAEEYYENYKSIVDLALEKSEAEVLICAITPIRVDFTNPGTIDAFNEQIQALVSDYEQRGETRVHFVDYTEYLKDENGDLLEEYDGGDGIHLAPDAYYIALHELYKEIYGVSPPIAEVPDLEELLAE